MPDRHPWKSFTDRRLTDLTSLQTNWDGRGAAAPTPTALRAAAQFLGALSTLSHALPALPHPGGITPTVDGGISITWRPPGGAWADVEFTPDGRTEAQAERDGAEALYGHTDTTTDSDGNGGEVSPIPRPTPTPGHTQQQTAVDLDRHFGVARLDLGQRTVDLADAVTAACPGAHHPRQHRDGNVPWCDACGRTRYGWRNPGRTR